MFTAIKSWLHRLFGKDEKTAQPVNQKKMKKLSRADRKRIEAAIARANRTDKKEKSAQDSIPYERMWPDGICRVAGSRYTKTIQFQDINYQLSQNEDKTAIFEGWCDFLNYFDSSHSALRKILCKRYSTNVKNGAVFCALAGLNSLGFLSPGLALQYARPQGVNAARA